MKGLSLVAFSFTLLNKEEEDPHDEVFISNHYMIISGYTVQISEAKALEIRMAPILVIPIVEENYNLINLLFFMKIVIIFVLKEEIMNSMIDIRSLNFMAFNQSV